jgi:hypothetical protein
MKLFKSIMDLGAAILMIMVAMAAHIEESSMSFRERDWWVFPKQQTEWDVIQGEVWRLSPALLDEKWIENYRMSYMTFEELVEDLTPFIKQKDTRWRKAIPVDKAVAMVLFRLAHGYSPKHVGRFYGVGGSTVIKYTTLIVDALSDQNKLRGKYIQVPSGTNLKRIIARFKAGTGLDNMCGSIDGSHIKLYKKPASKYVPAQYWSRHDMHSILLQGICDYDRVFWSVACRQPGGCHDAAHLRTTQIWEELRGGRVLQEPVVRIQGKDIKPYIVGDSAYPLMSFLLKAFNNRATGSPDQNLFDKHLRKGRVKIENAFGILKNRWQILKNLNVGLEMAPKVVVVCCVLHNICQRAGEPGDNEDILDPQNNNLNEEHIPPLMSEYASKRIGQDCRTALLRDFASRNIE